MITRIINNSIEYGIIISKSYKTEGISFFTPDDYSQQLAYMNRPYGYIIPPHVHNSVPREVKFTREVLFIRSGKVRIDFYNNEEVYIESHILYEGDVILLASGGHGFEMLENSEIIEVKQGPYTGENDKTRFESISAKELKIIK